MYNLKLIFMKTITKEKMKLMIFNFIEQLIINFIIYQLF